MTEDFGHGQFVVDLCAISVFALLIVGALFLFGTTALLIGAAWCVVGAVLAFLIGPWLEEEE